MPSTMTNASSTPVFTTVESNYFHVACRACFEGFKFQGKTSAQSITMNTSSTKALTTLRL